MDGGVFPPLVSPWCPVCASARSAPAWPSASPPGNYTPQLGRVLVLTYPENHLECPGIIVPAFLVALLPRPSFCHNMLCLAVHNQFPLCQVLPEIWKGHPILLPLLLTPSLPHHLLCVGFVCSHLRRLPCLAHHLHGFQTFFCSPTGLKSTVSISKVVWSHHVSV